MHRQASRTLRRISSLRCSNTPTTTRFFTTQPAKMSIFFPRINEFSPLFQLANEIDRATGSTSFASPERGSSRVFAPRFDVKETKETYELYGELPGIEQSNVNIEWSDDHTLIISGHTEKKVERSNIPEAAEDFDVVDNDTASEKSSSYHKPSVEEEGEASAATPAEQEQAVTKTEPKQVTKAPEAPKSRFWVSERSYGRFHRTFQFPGHVAHDAVKANLKNGILEIVIPKAKAPEPRRIAIQ